MKRQEITLFKSAILAIPTHNQFNLNHKTRRKEMSKTMVKIQMHLIPKIRKKEIISMIFKHIRLTSQIMIKVAQSSRIPTDMRFTKVITKQPKKMLPS